MKAKLLHTVTVGLLTALSLTASAEMLMQWEREPLTVNLNVKQERVIFVDKNVKVGVPAVLDGKLRVQSSGGAVYLTSAVPFDLTRLQLRDMETGELILLDVRSRDEKGKLENIRIVNGQNVANNRRTTTQTTVSDETTDVTAKPQLPAPAALVRYAAQSLYAPLRTVEPLVGVRRVGMKLPKTLPTLLPNLSVTATPLESWGLDGYVVTAVRIKNKEAHRVELDPRYLQGRFYAATFQHSWLGEKGTPEDTTVVYLVTEGDISHALVFNKTTTKSSTSKKKVVKKTVKTEE